MARYRSALERVVVGVSIAEVSARSVGESARLSGIVGRGKDFCWHKGDWVVLCVGISTRDRVGLVEHHIEEVSIRCWWARCCVACE